MASFELEKILANNRKNAFEKFHNYFEYCTFLEINTELETKQTDAECQRSFELSHLYKIYEITCYIETITFGGIKKITKNYKKKHLKTKTKIEYFIR